MKEDLLVRLDQAWVTITRQLHRDMASKGLEADLTRAQSYVLRLLRGEPGQRISDLAGKMGISPSAITCLIDSLENKGYLRRQRSDRDRRVIRLELTPEGYQELEKMERERAQILAQYGARLKPEELSLLVELLEKMAGISVSDEED